jgi:NAD(P)-dependent dehydrogenase (short-subunit alcohol dehydrogenase family)
VPPSIVPDTTLPSDIPESHQTPANAPTKSLFSLDQRTVVVTGADRGLGIVLATAVLEAGGDVVCLDVLPAPSESEWNGINKIQQKGSRTHASYHQCDITNEDAVTATLAETAKEAAKRGKHIRGLISCAGIQSMTDAIDYPLDGFRRILEVNVTGSFLVAKHTARIMREEGTSGSIVFIASMSGQIANRVSRTLSRPIERSPSADLLVHRAFIVLLITHPRLQYIK